MAGLSSWFPRESHLGRWVVLFAIDLNCFVWEGRFELGTQFWILILFLNHSLWMPLYNEEGCFYSPVEKPLGGNFHFANLFTIPLDLLFFLTK